MKHWVYNIPIILVGKRRFLMNSDIILIDGGVGTSLWEKTDDKVAVWRYNIEKPEIVLELHKEMADAGAKYVLANTFGANRLAMKGTDYTVPQIISRAMELAHNALDGRDVNISLAMGPLTGLLKPFGPIDKEEAYDIYHEMAEAGIAGRPDAVYIQTFLDLEMAKIAAKAVRDVDPDIPLMISLTFTKSSPKKGPRTMMGNSVPDIIEGLRPFDPIGIGLNCSSGPEDALPIIETFSRLSDIPLIFKPNAGKPMMEGGSEIDYDEFAAEVSKAAEYPGVKFIGGCCGANAGYIAALRNKLAL